MAFSPRSFVFTALLWPKVVAAAEKTRDFETPVFCLLEQLCKDHFEP